MNERTLPSNLNLLATAPDGVAKLRELILTLAVQGDLDGGDLTPTWRNAKHEAFGRVFGPQR